MQADSEWNNGNHQEAHDAARKARGWGIAGLVAGVILYIFLVILFIVVPVVAGAAASA